MTTDLTPEEEGESPLAFVEPADVIGARFGAVDTALRSHLGMDDTSGIKALKL